METIAAISTAPGLGGIGIIRITGDRAFNVLLNIFKSISNALSPVILIIPIPPSPGAVDIAAIVSIITSL